VKDLNFFPNFHDSIHKLFHNIRQPPVSPHFPHTDSALTESLGSEKAIIVPITIRHRACRHQSAVIRGEAMQIDEASKLLYSKVFPKVD
jgi:hypothetical protein